MLTTEKRIVIIPRVVNTLNDPKVADISSGETFFDSSTQIYYIKDKNTDEIIPIGGNQSEIDQFNFIIALS